MKRQFVRIQPSIVSSDPQQEVASEEWLSTGMQAEAASAPYRETPAPPLLHPQSPISQEFLTEASWNGDRGIQAPEIVQKGQYYAQNANPVSIVEQPTEIQKPVNVARPAYNQNIAQSPSQMPPVYAPGPAYNQNIAQGYPPGPISSGTADARAWAYATEPAYRPVQQAPVSQAGVPNALMSQPLGPPVQQGMSSWQQQMFLTGNYSGNQSYANYAPAMPKQSARQLWNKKERTKKRFPTWARVVITVITILLVAAGSGFWYYQSNFATAVTKITDQQAANIGKDGQSTNQIATTSDSIGTKRVNILLLGSDTDGKNTAPLAQTDIVVTIDPQTNYVGMLSIPRDLRVVIPNNGKGKLDAAFSYGWTNEHVGPTPFSNAAGLSIATIEKNFAIPIDHYAWVGLDGFVKVIDTAGGVDIDATHPIIDNSYPDDVSTTNHFDYKRLYIPPGPQHMNGKQALEYVRTRHADLVGDFGRSARQQQILNQLKIKLDTPSIITRLPELANALGDTVKTDMSIQELVNFMGFARNIDTNKIDRLVLSPPYSASAPDKTGDFLPNCAMIIPKIAQMFGLANNANCISMASTNTVSASGLATISPEASTSIATHTTPQSLSLPNTASLAQNNGDIGEAHSLLDLMLLAVFESFDATKV